MKVLKWILGIIVVLIAAVLIIALFLPSTVVVTASGEVNQPKEKVFHMLASYTDRQAWDPWVETDSTTEVIVTPAEGYTGSVYSWSGEKIGGGKMEVASVEYPGTINSYLMFEGRPDTSMVTWTLEEIEGGTALSWGFEAEAAYPMGRIFLTLMKGQLQGDFEKGLQNLSELMDSKELQISVLSEITTTSYEDKLAMAGKASGTMDVLISEMQKLFTEVMKVVGEQNLSVTGPPFAYYTDYKPEDQSSTMYCGVPVAEAGKPTSMIMPVSFKGSKAITAVHTGPYDELSLSYGKMMQYINENQIPANFNAMEVYLNDPMETAFPAMLKTQIYMEITE